MITLNRTPFPLFLTFEEAPSYGHEVPLSDTLAFAGRLVVGAATSSLASSPARSTSTAG